MTDDAAPPRDETSGNDADRNGGRRTEPGRSEAVPDPGGPLDVTTLEVLGRRARTHDLVDGWGFRPDRLSPRRLAIRLDATQYPDAVDDARLDVRWYEGGQYSVHYVETRGDDAWQCRWDRHPKPDAPTAHFHPPPDAVEDVEPSDLAAAHHIDVLFSVLERIGDRVADLHGD